MPKPLIEAAEKPILEHIIDLKEDGSFRLNLDYFNYCTGLTMTNERFDALFDGAIANPFEPVGSGGITSCSAAACGTFGPLP